MIEEQYVTFETAKLAKEKGFDESVRKYFTPKGDNTFINYFYLSTKYLHGIARPTQSLLARWLREKHDLSVEVYATASGFAWCVCAGHEGIPLVSPGDCDEDDPDTYEASKEIALQKALELIKRGSIKKWKYRN